MTRPCCPDSGKIVYATAAAATRAAAKIRKRPGFGALRVYRCQFCCEWHIGNQRKRGTRKAVRR